MSDESSQSRSPVLMLITALVAMFSGVVVIPRASDSATPANAGTVASPKEGAAQGKSVVKQPKGGDLPTVSVKDPRRPFQEFWEIAPLDAGKEIAEDLCRKLDSIEPEFLIATVPDPIDSRFGYRFDAILDDVQMAMESFHWNLDRFWLPWQPSGEQPSHHDTLVPIVDTSMTVAEAPQFRLSQLFRKGSSDKSTTYPELHLHERRPGVLIFRRPQTSEGKANLAVSKQQIMVVFLVGERPTSGVHKAAIGEAFNVIDRVARTLNKIDNQKNFDHPNFDKLRNQVHFNIVGPYFSGSERSISMSIDRWTSDRLEATPENPLAPESWRFLIRTGGSNQIDQKKFARDAGDGKQNRVSVTLEATMHHFDDVMTELFRYLRNQNGGWPIGKVALLTESDTQFGNAVETKKPGQIESDWRWGAKGATITTMKFPFHVSQVAIAYDQNKQADDKTALPSLAHPSSKLTIPFDETGSPRDIVPALSPGMTAASDEFDLAKILETIAMEDYRYVGIVATDTRDVIFLARLIREYCPDVQLFSPAGDLLLGHPTYASQLRGMIVGSPYPLFSMAQRWDPPHEGDHRRHLFMHESDQGYYNATLTLLAPAEKKRDPESTYYTFMYDYGPPFGQMDLIEAARKADFDGRDLPTYKPSEEELEPPIWIGVIGQRGIWPLEYQSSETKRDFVFRPQADDIPNPTANIDQFIPLIPQFTWIWGALVLGLSALAWVVLWVHGQIAFGPSDPIHVATLLRPINSRERGSPWRPSQEGFVYASIGILLMIYSYIVMKSCRLTLRHSPWSLFIHDVRLLRHLPWGDFWNWFFGLVAILLSAATLAAFVAAITIRSRSAPKTPRPTDAAIAAWCIALSALTTLLIAQIVLQPDANLKRAVGEHVWLLRANILMILCLLWAAIPRAMKWMRQRKTWSLGFKRKAGRTFKKRLLYVRDYIHLPVAIFLFTLSSGIFFDPPLEGFYLFVQIIDALILMGVSFFVARLVESSQAKRRRERWEKRKQATAQSHASTVSEPIPAKPLALNSGNGSTIGTDQRGHQAALTATKLKSKKVAKKTQEPPSRPPQNRPRPVPRKPTQLQQVAIFAIPILAGFLIFANEIRVLPRSPYVSLLYLERSVSLGNGVSPLVPVLLIGMTAGSWLLCQLRRLDFIDRLWKDRIVPTEVNPLKLDLDIDETFSVAAQRKSRLLAASNAIRKLLNQFVPRSLFSNPTCLITIGVTILVSLRLYERFVPTADGLAFNRTMILALSALIAAVALSLVRFILVWCGVRKLLHEFSLMPMQRAFDRVPHTLSRQVGPYLNALEPQLANLELTVRLWARVVDEFDRDGLAHGLYGKAASELTDCEKKQLNELAKGILGKGYDPAHDGDASYRILRLFEQECADATTSQRLCESKVRQELRSAGGACMSILVPYWNTRTLNEGYGESPRSKSKGADRGESSGEAKAAITPPPHSPWNDQTKAWLESAEDLLALELVNFVSECTIHLKNLAMFLAVAPFLLLLAVSSYPFQPQRFLIMIIWGLLFAVAGGVLWAYVQMERNEVLSRIAKTPPDRVTLNWSFLTQTSAVTIPLLGAFFSQFPFVSDSFNQWLEPVIRILK